MRATSKGFMPRSKLTTRYLVQISYGQIKKRPKRVFRRRHCHLCKLWPWTVKITIKIKHPQKIGLENYKARHPIPIDEQFISILTSEWETEFHDATSPSQGPVYNEYILPGPLFACTCHIPSHPTPFGSSHVAFPNKKAARTNAAQEAMKHIIAQGLANSDGSLKAKKKAKISTAVKVEDNGIGQVKSTTSGQKVNGKSH